MLFFNTSHKTQQKHTLLRKESNISNKSEFLEQDLLETVSEQFVLFTQSATTLTVTTGQFQDICPSLP